MTENSFDVLVCYEAIVDGITAGGHVVTATKKMNSQFVTAFANDIRDCILKSRPNSTVSPVVIRSMTKLDD